ncbi:MAG TPA: hypothetical protein VFT87_02205, partial [Candidatus Saccharimonadales bacterium]|nr:hypothetical protein [Candidatus Saccharimonadales bacterium]
MNNDRAIVDRVVYLASLVSDPDAIEPMIDTIRSATASMNTDPTATLSGDARTKLLQVEGQLTTYLTTQDPVRSFSRDSLQQKVQTHFKHQNPVAHSRSVTLGMVALIFLVAFVAYGIGLAIIPGEMNARFSLAVPLFMTTLNVGIAWLFWSARTELAVSARRATGALAIGLLFSAAASGQYPIFSALPQLSNQPAFLYGGILAPFTFMYILYFSWFYLYARQLPEVRVGWLRPIPVALAAIALAIGAVLTPHPGVTPNELWFDLSFASIATCIFFSGVAAILGFRLAKKVTR